MRVGWFSRSSVSKGWPISWGSGEQEQFLCSVGSASAPPLARACPLPSGTHIYAVLARWSRGSSWSRRALWSYSLKGLGERERRVYFCIRRNVRAKSESNGQVLQHNPTSALTLHPSGPLPSWVDSEELRIGARFFGKPF